jgi:hypothetical protein
VYRSSDILEHLNRWHPPIRHVWYVALEALLSRQAADMQSHQVSVSSFLTQPVAQLSHAQIVDHGIEPWLRSTFPP